MLDDADRRSYLGRFNSVARDRGWTIHASCLLDTHHHGVVETPSPDLGQGMRLVVGGHAAWFNNRHGRSGAVFGDRYWSTRVDDGAHLLRAAIYALVNPVAAGVVDHPREWPWSSYQSVEKDGCSDRLGAMLGDTRNEAKACFLSLVDEAAEIVRAERLADWMAVLRVVGEIATAGRRVGRG